LSALLAEVTQAQELGAARVTAMLTTETSTREVAAAWGSTTLHVKDMEDWATLAKREALERVSRADAENAIALASAREDVEGFARKIALLEDELIAERQALEVFERECGEQFEELTLLQTRGFEMCYTIVGPPRARHHLFEGMRLATLRHTEITRELAVLQVVMSSTMDSVLGRSPSDTFRVEVEGELATEF
jgi:hypothetical protein